MAGTRILLFGGTGQVGTALRSRAPSDWDLIAPTLDECDFIQPGDIAKMFRDLAPELVINAAAMVNFEACDAEPEKAKEINFHAVANMAAQCSTVDAPLIHLSTDYVFDGKERRPYVPDDKMNPLNVYGETKMMGEEAVRHAIHWHVILRCPLIFSATGQNALTSLLQRINTQTEIKAVTDQIMAPISADAVAEAILTVANAILHGKGNGFGTFHLSGEVEISRYDFLKSVMDAYAPFTDCRPKLISTTSSEMDLKPRPSYTVLNADKICDVYGIAPHDWHDDLEAAVKAYTENGLVRRQA